MSFVLEALKMQQAGTDPDAVAARALADIHQRRYRLWVGIAVAVTAVNVVVVLWLVGTSWLPRPGAEPAVATTPVEATLAAAEVVAEPAAPEVDTLPVPVQPSVQPPAYVPPPAYVQPAPQPVQRVTRLALGDLPSAARGRFPGIAFSTHIYAEDRDLRAIVANGRRLTEGESIRGLRIEEISATGVLLRFEDYLVDVPMTTDWD